MKKFLFILSITIGFSGLLSPATSYADAISDARVAVETANAAKAAADADYAALNTTYTTLNNYAIAAAATETSAQVAYANATADATAKAEIAARASSVVTNNPDASPAAIQAAADAARAATDATDTASVSKAAWDLARDTAIASNAAARTAYDNLNAAFIRARDAGVAVENANTAYTRVTENNYQTLSPITAPGGTAMENVNTADFGGYLNSMYRIGIGLCFVLGVIMFTWAGIEYIISEAMDTKTDAKKRINAALIGLAIALASYIILQTINPDLLSLHSLDLSTSPATR